jgi:hypothetical protein
MPKGRPTRFTIKKTGNAVLDPTKEVKDFDREMGCCECVLP